MYIKYFYYVYVSSYKLFPILVTIGKNQPLKHEKPKWKSDVPLTGGQLHSKRDEFWDTAPAFEGRKEIWDALKAAAYAAETNDYALAQAIIDGANISLPTGKIKFRFLSKDLCDDFTFLKVLHAFSFLYYRILILYYV